MLIKSYYDKYNQECNGFGVYNNYNRAVLILECIGAHGYRAHSSVAMARMFKGIMFDRDYFCRGSFWSFELCTGNLTEAWLMWTFNSSDDENSGNGRGPGA